MGIWNEIVGGRLDVATAERPRPGLFVSGDAALAMQTESGSLLVVVDGLGHGEEAAIAAQLAVSVARDCAGGDPEAILAGCHAALRKTRGCVMAVASLREDSDQLVWAGVGNVEGVIWPATGTGQRRMPSRPGIVGSDLRFLRSEKVAYFPGDILIMATDGITRAGLEIPPIRDSAPRAAMIILSEHARKEDDALVLVARRLRSTDLEMTER